ncbi:MAG: hypothetical protein JWM80_1089 [Cyanobacteria bacterium RYN_339]|nr:hypothetical protein [Cyanobacteria bacterium RYN_339]
MSTEDDAEFQKKVLEQSKRYYALQQGLVHKRQQLQRMLAVTDTRINAYKDDPDAFAPRYLRLLKRHMEIGLALMGAFGLDSNVAALAPATTTPQYKILSLEADLLQVEMEHQLWEAFAELLNTDLPAARAGEPPTIELPPVWLEEREGLNKDVKRAEQWEHFALEVTSVGDALAVALECRDQIDPELPPAEALAQWEALRLPTLKGVRYRVHGIARGLPRGELVLKSLQAFLVPPKAPPRARKGAKQVTDRLINIFKGN